MCLSDDAMRALDRMDEMGYLWRALGDLMVPESDLHTVDRDNLACALDVIRRDYEAARWALSDALDKQHSPAREAGSHHRTGSTAVSNTPAQSGATPPDRRY